MELAAAVASALHLLLQLGCVLVRRYWDIPSIHTPQRPARRRQESSPCSCVRAAYRRVVGPAQPRAAQPPHKASEQPAASSQA
eukprot:6190402-Pleurochrysis_carterae.AAC.5